MSNDAPPMGEYFDRAYLQRGEPAADSAALRVRLATYLKQTLDDDLYEISQYLKRERGFVIRTSGGYNGVSVHIEEYCRSKDQPIRNVLGCITGVWRYLRGKEPRYPVRPDQRGAASPLKSERWRCFVDRCFREENCGYTVDEACGVHPFVDEEFERNRFSALRAAEGPRYGGVRAEFEKAHEYLEQDPPDTKAAVRAMFEAVEILAKLIEPTASRLNKALMKGALKSRVEAGAQDATERKSIAHMFDGVAEWVDAIHNYRHGQGTTDPVAPSFGFAVYVLSTGAALLRVLLAADAAARKAAGQSHSAPPQGPASS